MIKDFVINALEEDLGRGDLFSQIFTSMPAKANLICKDNGIFAGKEYASALCEHTKCDISWKVKDGDEISQGALLASLSADAASLLQIERTLLNILQHASGIATKTNSFAKLLKDTKVRLLDTRKTRPLLRAFEKYAVRCGGGSNHRFGLDDALMLKDTHLALLKDMKSAVDKARQVLPFTTTIEIECESFAQAKEALNAGADIIMCDNMKVEQIEEVISFRNTLFPHVRIEASGNITIETVKNIAKTGVDAISVGGLIHQAKWLDFSMKMEPSYGLG
ncbi:MAG: carboxylating nicotinate-nucleotide diphosphorylase [Campylobacteraceae bacterium]|nr:carboxylating nicotinate-nucleotide diphosphorylase [Campylobacteraceae bacterium]